MNILDNIIVLTLFFGIFVYLFMNNDINTKYDITYVITVVDNYNVS